MSSLAQREKAPAKRIASAAFLRTYHFRKKEKDPVIDAVHTLFDEVGASLKNIHEKAGISRTTVYNWFDGPTCKPQYATLNATLRALGYEFQIVPYRHRINGQSIKATPPKIVRRNVEATA